MSDFPSSKFERGRIIAKTGLKVGTNYAQRYLKKRITGKEKSAKEFHSENAREVFKGIHQTKRYSTQDCSRDEYGSRIFA